MCVRVCVCVCPRGGLALRCSVQLAVSTEAPCQSTGRVSIMRMNMYIPHRVRTSANRLRTCTSLLPVGSRVSCTSVPLVSRVSTRRAPPASKVDPTRPQALPPAPVVVVRARAARGGNQARYKICALRAKPFIYE